MTNTYTFDLVFQERPIDVEVMTPAAFESAGLLAAPEQSTGCEAIKLPKAYISIKKFSSGLRRYAEVTHL